MISVIICSVDAVKLAAAKASYRAAMGDEAWELIHIDDAKSLAEGYNRGIERSSGQALVFSHDDVEVLTPGMPARLAEHLARFDLIGVAGARRVLNACWAAAGHPYIFGQIAHPLLNGRLMVDIYGVPRRVIAGIHVLDGVFMAARRSVIEAIHFDAETFDAFHGYDVDFSFQAYNAGMKLAVVNDIHMLHQSPGRFDEVWKGYAERFAEKWKDDILQIPLPRFQWSAGQVATRTQAIEVMTPKYWLD